MMRLAPATARKFVKWIRACVFQVESMSDR